MTWKQIERNMQTGISTWRKLLKKMSK